MKSENITAAKTLSRQVLQGGFWTFGLRGSWRVLDFLRIVILAHFLAPGDFGLMGIALIALQTLEVFSQTGFQAAIVQKKDTSKEHLNVAWTFLFIRGIGLCLLMIVIAPFVAAFFKTPQSESLVRVLGLSFLLQGFISIGVVSFQKELNFKKQYIYEISGSSFDFLISIILVLTIKNVWALVAGKIAGDLVKVITSYLLAPYKPKFDFHRDRIKELYHFGRWVTGSGIMTFIATQGDSVFVGRLLGAVSLGLYKMASTIANLPTTEITHVISQVTFPAYSKIQDQSDRLRSAFLNTLHLTAILSFFLTGIIIVLIPDFTRLFLGEKWLPMILPVQILVFAGLIRSIAAVSGPLFYAIGKPKTDTATQVARLVLFFISIYPLTVTYGLTGASFSVLISIFFANIYAYVNVHKLLKSSLRQLLKPIFAPLAAFLCLIYAAILSRGLFKDVNIIGLGMKFLAGAIIYFGIIFIYENYFGMKPKLSEIYFK